MTECESKMKNRDHNKGVRVNQTVHLDLSRESEKTPRSHEVVNSVIVGITARVIHGTSPCLGPSNCFLRSFNIRKAPSHLCLFLEAVSPDAPLKTPNSLPRSFSPGVLLYFRSENNGPIPFISLNKKENDLKSKLKLGLFLQLQAVSQSTK